LANLRRIRTFGGENRTKRPIGESVADKPIRRQIGGEKPYIH
jgi:hypothetical protein